MTDKREIIFNKPPVTEVRFEVQFPPNLEVADSRSKYHSLVRANFPHVLIAEQKKFTYDYGDYSLAAENLADRLEISMVNFALISMSYPGYQSFKAMFVESLSSFVNRYEINAFSAFILRYNNLLTFPTFSEFDSIFSIDVSIPGELNDSLLAARGVLIFKHNENYVTVEVEPQIEGEDITSYKLGVVCGSNKIMSFDEIAGGDFIDSAHDIIKSTFFSILQDKYLQYLRGL